ncbi:MAG TPA: FAD/NAD(P)-binding protein [Streptosporangiaceae bacterium]|nr:FAD/NAD(P)-binding protein [Streptosporangiaceae bacterium]
MRALTDPGAGAPPPGWATPAPWRVAATRREAPGVVTLELDAPAGLTIGFEPGQFTMLYAPAVGEVPISISGDPADVSRLVQTIRDVGPVTHALCALRPGDQLGVRGPYGTSWPVEAAAGGDVVVVAGGIGLPPLRPALYRILANRGQFGRVALLYGARTPADLLFTGELAHWRSRFDLEVEVTVDAAGDGWHGDVGVVPGLIRRARFDPPATTAFVVGPEVMMRFTVRALLAAGVHAGRLFVSMERNMQCAAALCGHCQLGPFLLCRDGPVLSYQRVAHWMNLREV